MTKTSNSKVDQPTLTSAERRVLRKLWSKMTDIYGYRWASVFGDSPERDVVENSAGAAPLTGAGSTWAEGLTGLSAQAIAAGVRRAVFSANGYPPTLPEFRAMCLGVPPLARVQLLLSRQDQADDPWLQGFVRLVLRNIDTWRLDQDDPKSFTFAVRDAYGLAREHVMSGGDVPPAPVGYLGSRSKKREKPVPAPDHVVEEHLSQIRELLSRQHAEGTDHGG